MGTGGQCDRSELHGLWQTDYCKASLQTRDPLHVHCFIYRVKVLELPLPSTLRELLACPLYHPLPFLSVLCDFIILLKNKSRVSSSQRRLPWKLKRWFPCSVQMLSPRGMLFKPSRGTRLFFKGNLALPNSTALVGGRRREG